MRQKSDNAKNLATDQVTRTLNHQVLISHHQEQSGLKSSASVKTCMDDPPMVRFDHRVTPTSHHCFEDERSSIDSSTENNDSGELQNRRNRRENMNNRHHPPLSLNDYMSPNLASSQAALIEIQQELLNALRHLIQKQEESERQQTLVSEWRLAAQVVDRILFWIFFFMTTISSGIFLLVLPLYKRTWNGPTPLH